MFQQILVMIYFSTDFGLDWDWRDLEHIWADPAESGGIWQGMDLIQKMIVPVAERYSAQDVPAQPCTACWIIDSIYRCH